jgi:hypothetical protein
VVRDVREHSSDSNELIAFLRPWAEKSKLAREILACVEKASMVEDMTTRNTVTVDVPKPRRVQFRYTAKPIEAARSSLDYIRDVLNESFTPLWEMVSWERGGAFETEIQVRKGQITTSMSTEAPVLVTDMNEGDQLLYLRQVPVNGKFFCFTDGRWDDTESMRLAPMATITCVIEFPRGFADIKAGKAALLKAGCFDVLEI